jgi:TonB family protein
MNLSKSYGLILLILASSVILVAQGRLPNSHSWFRLESANKEISVDIPQNFLVDTDRRSGLIMSKATLTDPSRTSAFKDQVAQTYWSQPDIRAFSKDVQIRFRLYKLPMISNSKVLLEFFLPGEEGNGEVRDAEVEGFRIRSRVYRNSGYLSADVYIAKAARIYVINASVKPAQEAVLNRLLASIKSRGNRALADFEEVPGEASQTFEIDSLKTSPEITEALKKKAIDKEALPNRTALMNSSNRSSLDRPVVILRPALPPIPQEMEVFKGTVSLIVTFQADGSVGEVFVDKSADNKRLDKLCVKKVRMIKFLPAMVDGKPIDTVQTISFDF